LTSTPDPTGDFGDTAWFDEDKGSTDAAEPGMEGASTTLPGEGPASFDPSSADTGGLPGSPTMDGLVPTSPSVRWAPAQSDTIPEFGTPQLTQDTGD
jgi:hypothetical protein